MAIFSEDSHPTSTHENPLEDSISESSQTEGTTSDVTFVEPQEQDKEKQAQEELHIYQDKYMRLAAEFENYKRRAQRDQSDAVRYANESLLKNLLSTIDNLERAIQSGKDAGASGALLDGVELTYKQFIETVGKLGVRQVSSTDGGSRPPGLPLLSI